MAKIIPLTEREYQEGDYERYIRNLTEEHMKPHFVEHFGGWSRAVSEKKFRKLLQTGTVKLFFHQSKFVGYYTLDVEKDNENSYLLHDLHVVDAFKGKGKGKEILLKVLAKAKEDGKEQVKAFVFLDNPAKRFYEANGFTVIEMLQKSHSAVMVWNRR